MQTCKGSNRATAPAQRGIRRDIVAVGVVLYAMRELGKLKIDAAITHTVLSKHTKSQKKGDIRCAVHGFCAVT